MRSECYPFSALPHMSRLFLDFMECKPALAPYYGGSPNSTVWMRTPVALSPETRARVADVLAQQNTLYAAGDLAFRNIQKLREGNSVVVTGQQVALFGGPLYAFLKAATAIRYAQEATRAGHPSVPIFWMATEDHDFAEVDHVMLPERHALHELRLERQAPTQVPVGGVRLGDGILPLLEGAGRILGSAFTERLRAWYQPQHTFAQAFGAMMAAVFAQWGLVVMDASARELHQAGSDVLRRAVVDADALHAALVERSATLEAAGYHAQVLVGEGNSLLFLLDKKTGARVPLRRVEGGWKAGGRALKESDLLAILAAEPERLSPNALLRPVFQDAILPTLAYIGGPAEIAYFAQSDVLYRELLGRSTPILPRLSATLVEPAIATVMERHELSLPNVFTRPDDLAQRLGARSMPIEGKQKLAAAGRELDRELTEVTRWMASLDEGLGRSAHTAASKMRYQMNRLRRLAAHYQLERDASLNRHAIGCGERTVSARAPAGTRDRRRLFSGRLRRVPAGAIGRGGRRTMSRAPGALSLESLWCWHCRDGSGLQPPSRNGLQYRRGGPAGPAHHGFQTKQQHFPGSLSGLRRNADHRRCDPCRHQPHACTPQAHI